jgi:ABC-2 type transport system ATP-binding protein
MTDLPLDVRGLAKRYGRVEAVRRVDLTVPQGAIYGFLGPNGAGKTTTIRCLLGLIRADAGTVRVDGHDIRRNRRAALARVGAVVETPALYPNLTGYENLQLACRYLDLPGARIGAVLETVEMTRDAGRKVGQYSLGMRQRLGLARALIGEPRLLILDEPTNGLDPSGMRDMRALIRDLPERTGATVFMSSHLLSEVEQIATHVGVMRQGETVFDGAIGALAARTGQRLEIRCDKPDAAAPLADSHGFTVESRDDEAGSFILSGDGDPARLNAALVSAGIAVSALAPLRADLESLFLDLTSEPLKEAVA